MSAEQIPRQVIALARLSQLEWEIRQAEDADALDFIAANDTHRVVEYDHALVYREQGRRITTVSGALQADRTAPQLVWFARLSEHLAQASELRKGGAGNGGAGDAQVLQVEKFPREFAAEFDQWISGHGLWMPHLGPHGRRAGGTFLLRRQPFSEGELRILARLGSAFGHAAAAHAAPQRYFSRHRAWWTAARWAGALTALLLVMHAHLPLTVLAEARVVPVQPLVVASPLNGVVEKISVTPNEIVVEGEELLRLDATELLAEREIAAKRLMVLTADHLRTEQKAFLDPAAMAEVGLARSRLAEGRAELAIADDRLARVAVTAPRGGIAVFDDPNAWTGRPVRVGERVMSIADPRQVKLEIQVGVEDMLVVEPGAEVEFFLATAPGVAVGARLENVSYDVRILPSQSVAFIAEATFAANVTSPRLGMTGTAKIIGPRAPLYFLLLRKPLSAFRRLSGL